MTIELRHVRPDEPVTAQWANALVEAVRALSRWSAAFPLELSTGPSGYRLHLVQQIKIEVFELSEDLSSGSTAAADIVWYDGALWTQASTDAITVADPLGTFEGASGDRGIALFHSQSGLWLILQLQC